ncbi:uncharacterized protein KY384_001196 [Bacidia gigantensis]|uniref:uncharacterized protein n=1 Tax=Bacidia gigantensis TaxID=2732470 RepID=UPI001D05B5FB|nr:uncharacterized protein KY384_001196 [Bacidia gigantensis]KAG8534352.1 hypothetical protein KY384_001196 [Bacidia gigantensis]
MASTSDSNTPIGARPTLISLPSEITIQVICRLPRLADVLALSATCKHLRDIWSSNVTQIYDCLASKSIPCLQHARSFYADQEGLAVDDAMSTTGVARMMRNARIVEKAIVQFEREIVSRVKTDGISADELEQCYGVGARGHPPTMTPTERGRFVQSYYTLWGLMIFDTSRWTPRLEVMTSQELYYLHEMTKLTQNIGGGESVPAPLFPDQPPDSVHAIDSGRSGEREILEYAVWHQIDHISQRIFGEKAIHADIYAKHEGFMGFVVIWDHWQISLKDAVLHLSRIKERPNTEAVKRYLWNDDYGTSVETG